MPSLILIMACRLIGTKPIKSNDRLLLNCNLLSKFQCTFNWNTTVFLPENDFENIHELAAILCRPQCVHAERSFMGFHPNDLQLWGSHGGKWTAGLVRNWKHIQCHCSETGCPVSTCNGLGNNGHTRVYANKNQFFKQAAWPMKLN